MQVLFVAKSYVTSRSYKVPRIILWFLHSQTVRYALNSFELFQASGSKDNYCFKFMFYISEEYTFK